MAKTELAEAQRDKIRFKLAVEQKKYMLKEDVEKQQAELIVRVRTKLLGIPAKLTARITGLTDREQVYSLLSEAVTEALNELASEEEEEGT